MVEATSDGVLKLAHAAEAPAGPKSPRAGPVLPSSEIDTERTSVIVRSGSKNDIVSIDAVTRTIHELTMPSMIQTLSSSTTD